MVSTILSGAFCGLESYLVRVEVDVAQGLPCMEMIGCLSREAGEAKQRIRVALKNIGIPIPPSRITINLSPADRHKSGTAFDLPSAVGLLVSMERIRQEKAEGILFVGELGLAGEVKPVKGILPMVQAAAKEGIKVCIVPEQNGSEAAVVESVKVYGVSHITQVITALTETMEKAELYPVQKGAEPEGYEGRLDDFGDISGQDTAKRAAEIAVAGFHHMLLIGTPGSGKTMLARRLPSVMPPLSHEESLEVSGIYSVCGRLKDGRILRERPFLAPHHTVTGTALIGGGRLPIPGAVSLAHRGVLFLDEMAEFKRPVLEMLRQPLEDRRVQISRTYGNITYPADFMLIGAMNPCPCGYYPDHKRCSCSEAQIQRYLGKISGPLLDRMDLCVEMEPMETGKMLEAGRGESSAGIRMRVMNARRIQEERFADAGIRFNSEMRAGELQKYCRMDKAAREQLKIAAEAFSLSLRACHKILRTARTIGDLEGSETVKPHHINEAVYYRTAAGRYWGRR